MLRDEGKDITLAFTLEMPADVAPPKKRQEVCQNFQAGVCRNGAACPERHVITALRYMQQEVCRYWLRGGCANGPDCLFLHEYDERLIPECAFFARLGECTNAECHFKHTNPEDKVPRCAAFERGFCPLGPSCHLRHVKRDSCCPAYLAGFCPYGVKCPLAHPVQQLYDRGSVSLRICRKLTLENRDNPDFHPGTVCFKCLDPGHQPRTCPGGMYGRIFQATQQVQEPGERSVFSTEGRPRGCFICADESHTIKECQERQHYVAAAQYFSGVTGVEGASRFQMRGGDPNRRRPRAAGEY